MNLAILNSWFLSRVHRSDRLRFWKAYFISRKSCVLPVDLAPPRRFALLAVDLEQRTWEYNFSSWKRRERRCMKNNRYFHKVSGFGCVGHAVTDLDPQSVQDLLRDPDEPLSRPGVKLLKDSISSTVAELDMVVAGKVRRVIYKRFRVTSWTDPFTSLLRPTPALRSWVHGQRFRERSLPTARPLLVKKLR